MSLPPFDELEAALRAVSSHVGAAEAQGLLCGMRSASDDTDTARWIARVLEDTEPRGDAARHVLELLTATWQETNRGLGDSNLELNLMLPGDEQPLSRRAAALGHWCQGALYGLGHDPEGQEHELPEDVREAVTSLAEIARVDPDANDEDDEAAYAELVEFVRVATLLIHEHMQPLRRTTPVDVRLPPEGKSH